MVDIGAGITNIAVYLDGRLALVRTLQRGGENVTRDIAAVLQTTTEEAERIKILHGCVDPECGETRPYDSGAGH